MVPAPLLDHSTSDTHRWPGPAPIGDAVATFRCTAEGRQWQRAHFAETLRLLANDGGASGQQQARVQLQRGAAPAGLEPAAVPALIASFLHEMTLGEVQRRAYLPRLLLLQQPRAPLFDQRVSLALPLLAEFELALQGVEPTLRTLFVEELRCMAPAHVRQLAHLA